jgi:NitT/TauT family transport system substrate-binding protein
MTDPKAAIEAVAKREPLIKTDVELAKLEATFGSDMNHPEIDKIGLGDIDGDRMAKSIDIIVMAKELSRTPKVGEIFDRSYLPPLGDRPTAIKSAM